MRSEEAAIDDRREPRLVTLLGGEIVSSGGERISICLVRNISEYGCRLLMSNTVAVPGWFTLWIRQYGREFPAQVRWRSANMVGVEFGEPDVHDDAA